MPAKQYGRSDREVAPSGAKPSAQQVADFHENSDLDTRAESQHHSLGPGPTQSSPGDHRHDGGSSPLILDGFTISGSRNSDQWRISVNQILVRLGATDSTTP